MSDNWLFVGAAFSVTWGVLLGYLLHLRRVQSRANTAMAATTAAGSR